MAEVYNIRSGNVPANAVNIMRPSKWGNPFVVGVHGTREQVIEMFEMMVLTTPGMLEEVRAELAGKDLVCCCYPRACHGNVLTHLANAPESSLPKIRAAAALAPGEGKSLSTEAMEISGLLKSAKSHGAQDKEEFTARVDRLLRLSASLGLRTEHLRAVSEAAFTKRRRRQQAEYTAWTKLLDGLDIREERVDDGHDDVPNSATYSLTMSESDFYELQRRLGALNAGNIGK